MEMRILAFFFILTLFFTHNFLITNSQAIDKELQTYIVYVEEPKYQNSTNPHDLEAYHMSFLLESSVRPNRPSPSLVYSYRHVITGFAAKLTVEHLKSIEKKDGFLFAHAQKFLSLHTTHTPKFLGLQQNSGFWHKDAKYGKGVIIGVIDDGLTPDHPSFSDEGMPPPPEKWKGKCEYAKCNNKLIGARSFTRDSARKSNGCHGTHTSSTAAGNFVKGAHVLGQAKGTAVGMAPLAHVAMYEACRGNGCLASEVLAAMDAAINDKVDILSISLGVAGSSPFYYDVIAIASLAAVKKGIFVSCSAGNEGPGRASLSNGAPWILTVGASTVDRSIRSTAVLGNKEQFDGETLYQPQDFPPTPLPLIYAGMNHDPLSASCGSLKGIDVKGKVVLCEGGDGLSVSPGEEVKGAGGAAMILMNDVDLGYNLFDNPHVLPAVEVSYAAGVKIKEYINSTTTPTTSIIFKGTVIGGDAAPEVAYFSSRGPNTLSPGILKPDIIGPGVNVLAAWCNSDNNKNKTPAPFEMDCGTSMSCPHLSGIAALLKSSHPDWSPAAIKSAMMTTADINNLGNKLILNEKRQPADFFAIGAGHINASRANDPGLIYDINPHDYIPYLCGLKYNRKQMEIITKTKVDCSKVIAIPEAELNYPSFSVALGTTTLTYTRTLTNVGPAKSSYESFVTNPPGVEVTVKPKSLEFTSANQKLTYEIIFSRLSSAPMLTYVQGYIEWLASESSHHVRSPLSIKLM